MDQQALVRQLVSKFRGSHSDKNALETLINLRLNNATRRKEQITSAYVVEVGKQCAYYVKHRLYYITP
jgi:hypothetical protein